MRQCIENVCNVPVLLKRHFLTQLPPTLCQIFWEGSRICIPPSYAWWQMLNKFISYSGPRGHPVPLWGLLPTSQALKIQKDKLCKGSGSDSHKLFTCGQGLSPLSSCHKWNQFGYLASYVSFPRALQIYWKNLTIISKGILWCPIHFRENNVISTGYECTLDKSLN